MRTLQISDSSLSTAYFCPRRYYYERVRRFRLIGQKPEYMQLGDVMHKMLEVFYRLQGEEGVSYSDRIEIAREIGIKHATMQPDITLPEADIMHLIETLLEYADFWKNDGWKVQSAEQYFSIILYERPDAEGLEGLRILYEGKIDLMVEDPKGEGQHPVDHKTSKSFKTLKHPSMMSGQFIGYAVATDATKVIENKVGLQKTYPPEKKFLRHPITFDHKVMEEWKGWTVVKAMEIDSWIQNDYYPPNYGNCRNNCPFTTICFTRPEVREWKLNRDFIYVPPSGHKVYEKVTDGEG